MFETPSAVVQIFNSLYSHLIFIFLIFSSIRRTQYTQQQQHGCLQSDFWPFAVVSVAVVQISGKPATDTEWGIPFEEALKNITKKIGDVVGDNSEYTAAAKNGLNTFVDGFKSELAVLSKSFEGKAGVSDVVKEATKQWQTTIDTYTKNLPKEVSLKDFNEKTEQA
ncbi:hypothetical protein H477_5889, partial [[Clostridium] sordellii ATCC 9714]